MKLFEAAWKQGYEYFERYYDTELKKSVKTEIKEPFEWYIPMSNGNYMSILDSNIKLDKRQSHNPKDGREYYGFADPISRKIRDTYWKDKLYNKAPRTWYLDIETRVSRSYKNPTNSQDKIKLRNSTSEQTVTLKRMQMMFNLLNENEYEYYNNSTKTWDKLTTNHFMQRNRGFPVPEKSLEEISLIQIYDSIAGTVILLGTRDWKHQDDYNLEYPTKYIKCENEIKLLETYLEIFRKLDPLLIYAWNGDGFDFPYIYNRLKKLGFNKHSMSNYGNVKYTEREFKGRLEFSIKTDGHFYVDMMVIYKNFVFSPRPNYQLDTIAEIELKENKVKHTEYKTFDDFYTGNYVLPSNPTEEQTNSKIYKEVLANGLTTEARELAHSDFCYYGYKDPLLIKHIDDKLKFTTLQIMVAEKMGVQISDATSTVKPWSQFISNRALLNNKVLPPKKENDDPHVVGGFVKDPIKGKHEWILSGDVNSMYPLLGMVGFNMSPETFIPKSKLPGDLRDIVLTYFNDQHEENRLNLDNEVLEVTQELLKKYNYSLAINGAVFDKNELGMVPELVQEIYNGRKKAKKIMFNYEQRKILIKEIIKEKSK